MTKIFSMGVAALILFWGLTLNPVAAMAGAEAASVGFDGALNAKGLPADWNLKVHEGTAKANLVAEKGEKVLHMKSSDSSFALDRDVAVDVREYPYLVWSWKAVSLPPQGDVREKSKDDQALQLLVGFKDGRVLSYVWDTNAPEGTVVSESLPWPLSVKIKVLVVESGGTDVGKWITNTRNVYNDYKRLFGKEPPAVAKVRLQMNTQYTGDSAEGFVGGILFSRSVS